MQKRGAVFAVVRKDIASKLLETQKEIKCFPASFTFVDSMAKTYKEVLILRNHPPKQTTSGMLKQKEHSSEGNTATETKDY